MPVRLAIFLTLVLALAAPVALAQEPPPAAPAPAQCEPDVMSERAFAALRKAVRKPLPTQAGETIAVKLDVCAPGRVRLRVRRRTDQGPLLAHGDETFTTLGRQTIELTTTRAVERKRRGRKVMLRLRALYTPAA